MKLVRVRLRNFRCFGQEASIDIDDLTVLVGKNDAGKSTILDALAIFFKEAKIEADDACVWGDSTDVRLICEFTNLPDSLVLDAEYPTTLVAEHLLNEHDRLEVHMVYNCALKTPKPTGVYARAVHPNAPGVDDLLLLTNTELKKRAVELGVDLQSIDSRVNTQLRKQMWASVTDLCLEPREIPLDKVAAKKAWDQLKKYLPIYALFKSDRPSTDQDAEAQDPMKAAVKEALSAKQAELTAIAEYVKAEVCSIAEATVEKLREMDPSLASQLRPQFKPPNWSSVFKIGLADDDQIPMNKRGSGVRRLILINFFRAKAEQAAREKGAVSVIYAVEEPETSQHPDNQRMLMRAFYQLADLPGCQVILSTHTPVLARLVPLNCLRYIGSEEGKNRSVCGGDVETYRRVAEALGVLPDHSVEAFIGVEGNNDINFLKGISRILKTSGEEVPDLAELEEEGRIICFPLGGSNLVRWKSRLAALNRPEFYVFDRDEKPPAVSKYQETVDELCALPRCKAVLTGKKEMENYLHSNAIRVAILDVEIEFGDFDDVPLLVAKAVHEASESEVAWDDVPDDKKEKKVSRAKSRLNTKAVDAMTPEMLDERDQNNDVRSWLQEISQLMASSALAQQTAEAGGDGGSAT